MSSCPYSYAHHSAPRPSLLRYLTRSASLSSSSASASYCPLCMMPDVGSGVCVLPAERLGPSVVVVRYELVVVVAVERVVVVRVDVDDS